MASTFERSAEERGDDLLGEADPDDPSTEAQHVRVVVLACHTRRVQVVAQRSADAMHLVGGQLLALSASAEHDAEIGVAVANRAADACADRGVVDRVGGIGALVVDLVAQTTEKADKVLFELESGVIGADGDAGHSLDCSCRTDVPILLAMPPALDPRSPVIVGVGQFLNRDDENPIEPVRLAAIAARLAADDCGAPSILTALDAVAVAPIVSWRYGDPGRLIAEELGATPSLTMYPTIGGNTPQLLMTRVCERIAAGEMSSALICGAEAYRTRMRAKKHELPLDWQRQDRDVQPGWTDGTTFEMPHQAEMALGIIMPTQNYPLFENALRHEAGRSAAEHSAHIAGIWAGFSAVAADNPHAWDRTPHTAEEIATVTSANRMVGFPYTKHMVSNSHVDMASAVLVCSVERATSLGIPRDRWVFPLSGADTKDPTMSNRTSFTSSAAIRHGGRAALDLAGVGIDDVAHVDVYSCFPSAVEIACAELGLSTDRQLTVYGGLCFAGGPWNNPVGHAICAMVDVLREDPGSTGLVTANGGNIQKHSFGVYSSEPPATGFRSAHPQFAVDTEPLVPVIENYAGAATIETWTVMHERDGSIGRSHAVLRTPGGERGWAVATDTDVGAALEAEDPIGWTVTIGPDAQLLLG